MKRISEWRKAKALVVFLFALISLGIFILSTLFALSLGNQWSGLVVGAALMLLAIWPHCAGKRFHVGYLISFLLNSIANGFSVSAYYLVKNIGLELDEMVIAVLSAAGIMVLIYLMLQRFQLKKTTAVLVASVINVLITVVFMVLWISNGAGVFSFGFFGSLISLFYLCVFGIAIGRDERPVLRDVSFGSFGAFVILLVVVIFVLSEGELLDGVDLDLGSGKKKKKVK